MTRAESPKGTEQSWFRHLIGILPGQKLTRAQTANIIMEAICAVILVPLAFKLTATCTFIAFVTLIGFAFWCHGVSKPGGR